MSLCPKVYTYYEPISKWEPDKRLVEFWIENWASHGFDPIILSKKDAKQNRLYAEFVKNISECSSKIMNRDIIIKDNPWSYYAFYTFIRHLSYANIDDDKPILIMDYDVYNINYEASEIKNLDQNLTFHFGGCPCIISGIPSRFQELCDAISQISKNCVNSLQIEFGKSRYTTLHDMAFISCMRHSSHPTISEAIKSLSIRFIPQRNSPFVKKMIHSSNGEITRHCIKNNINRKSLSQEECIDIRLSLATQATKTNLEK